MSALGRLVASVVLDTAEFTGGSDKAQFEAAKMATTVDRHLRGMESRAKATMAGIGATLAAGFSVAVLDQMVKETVKAAAALDDMSEKTGATVETLSGMVEVAKIGGHEIGLLEASMTKLAKGGEGSQRALTALGISARDASGRLKDTGTLTQEIAHGLAAYADGTGKAAIAQDLFGKSGAQLLPYLKDLAGAGKLVVKTTTEQAAAAEQYEKTLNKLAIAKGDLVRTVVTELVPVLQTVADMLLKSKTSADGTLASVQGLAGDGSIQRWGESVAYAGAFVIDIFRGVSTAVQVVGQAIAGSAQMAVALAEGVAGGALNGNLSAAYTTGVKIAALQADTRTQMQDILTSHKSIRFELDAQFAKQREINALVAKYAGAEFKDARDLRKPKDLDYTNAASPKSAVAVTLKSDLANIDKLLDQIMAKESGFEAGFGDKMATLFLAMASGRISVVQFTEAQAALIRQQPVMVKAVEAETRAREEAARALDKFIDGQVRANDQIRDQIAELQTQVDTFGMSRSATLEYAAAQLEAEAATLTLDEATQAQIDLLKERAALLRSMAGKTAEVESLKQQAGLWDSLSSAAGNFFSDLAMNGRSAFDNLRQSLKSFAADIIAFFAKRWVLQMVAGAGMGGASTAASASLTSMNATPMGTMFGGTAGTAFGLSAAAGGLGGYFGARAMGAGDRGQQVGGASGATLAMIGMAVAGPVGAAVGALLGAVIGKFTDPNGLAQRTGHFGSDINGGFTPGYSYSGALGQFGIGDTHWFGDDQAQQIKDFIGGMKGLDDGLAQYLTTDELNRAKEALLGAKQYGFGIEHSDGAAALGQILSDHINAVFQAIDPALSKFLDGFSGTGDELAIFATDLLGVRNALLSTDIPGLTLDGVIAMKAAGESLGQTLMRVVDAFASASNDILSSADKISGGKLGVILRANAQDSAASAWNAIWGGGETNAQTIANVQQYSGNLQVLQSMMDAAFIKGGQPALTALQNLFAAVAANTDATASSTTATNGLAIAYAGGPDAQYWADLAATQQHLADVLGAQANLASYLRGSLLSDNSPLDPMAKYRESQAQYQSMLGLAQGGNLDAMAGLGGARDQFLQFSRMVNASNGQYNTDFFGTYNDVAGLTGGQIRPYTAADATANTQTLVTALAANTAQTQQVVQAVAAMANAVIENAINNTADTKAVLVESANALNKIAANGGSLVSSGL